MLEAGFWDNQELAQQTTREVSELKRIIKRWQNVHELYEDVQVLLELVEESEDQDLKESSREAWSVWSGSGPAGAGVPAQRRV